MKRFFSLLAMVVLGLSGLTAPAQALPAAPTGCTTSIEWVQEGNNYYYGRGNLQCTTGRYKAKLVCRNLQTGVGYVKYGTLVVNAPATTTATCNTGNVAEGVYAVTDPPAAGLSGCVSWAEWVHEGNNHYFGRGIAQCDTGSYRVKITCQNLQTGQMYVVYGQQSTAPNTATGYCYSGNVAQSVEAVPQ